MALRSADLVFVLDQIRQYVASSSSTSTSTSTAPPPEHSFMSIFQQIDIEKIGVLGHSMGGATAAWLGREDLAVDAVVVLDGTMMGEVTGFESDKYMFTKVPYPKPILNIFNERHYHDGKQLGLDYANMRIHANAPLSFQAVVQGAGHLNFTDLPLISPILGRMLGTGSVDARYCIQETNRAVLEFLDYYVKDKGSAIPVFRTL